MSVLHVGADPTDLVDRALRADHPNRIVVDFSALLHLHDGVEAGLAMAYRMERMFRPAATGLAVRLPDLADVNLPAAALVASLDAVTSAAERLQGRVDAVLVAGATRDFLGRVGGARAARVFRDVRHADAPPLTPAQTARRLWAAAAETGGSLLDKVADVAGDLGKSDLLNALVCGEPLGPRAHRDMARVLADTYHAHAAMGGDLTGGGVSWDGDDGLRMTSPSFSFVIGICRVLLVAPDASAPAAARAPMLSRYDKSSYLARRRLAAISEPLPAHPSCLAALMSAGK